MEHACENDGAHCIELSVASNIHGMNTAVNMYNYGLIKLNQCYGTTFVSKHGHTDCKYQSLLPAWKGILTMI